MDASESPIPKASTPAYKLILGKPTPKDEGRGEITGQYVEDGQLWVVKKLNLRKYYPLNGFSDKSLYF